MSIGQFLRILWARRFLIILATLVCLAGAVTVGKLLPARFTATSRLMLDIVKPDPVTGEMLAGNFARAYTKTQIELIKDYRVAGRAADIVGWTTSPGMAAQYQARPRTDTRDFRHWLAQRIIDGTDANLIDASNILEISFTTTSPETAAKIADAIRQAYVEESVQLRREDARGNAEWFETQASKIRAELTEAEKRKADFEKANGIILDADMVDEDSKRLSALAASSVAPAAAGGVVAANPVAAQLAQADAAIAAASKVLGPNNPQLIDLKRQREAIAASAAASHPVAVGATGPSLDALYGEQQAKVLAQRGRLGEAQQLAMAVAALRDQYQKTIARVTELHQQADSNESGMTLLGNAVAPQTKSFPRWQIILPLGVLFGLALGVLAALMAELSMRRVRGADDLTLPGVPVLGSMVGPTPGTAGSGWRNLLRRNPVGATA